MKKKLVATLAAAMILGVAGTSFAAANPFSDVPAKHWAYASVMNLSQAGIVDGYGDGTYKGDKVITRYEMAQMVAKAMAKSDKADAKQKAEIDKLATEFSEELNVLGVRVSKIEKRLDNVKFAGNFQTRDTSTDYAGTKASAVSAEYRLRLDGNVVVNDVTTANFRFVTAEPTRDNFKNSTWQTFGDTSQTGNGSITGTNSIDRISVTTKAGAVSTTIGRQAFWVDTQGAMMDSGAFSFDGAKFATKTGAVNVTGTWGRFLKGTTWNGDTAAIAAGFTFNPGTGATDTNIVTAAGPLNSLARDLDVASLMAGTKMGKFDWSVGYYDLKNPVTNTHPFKWTVLNTNYNFTSKLSLNAEYLHNSGSFQAFTDAAGNAKGKNYWAVKTIIGDQNVVEKGQQNLGIQYASKQANSEPNHFTALGGSSIGTASDKMMAFDFKQLDVQYKYGFSKNLSGILEYTMVTPEAAGKATAGSEFKFVRALAVVTF